MDRIQGRAAAQLETLRAVRSRLEAIDVAVSSPDRRVRVRLDGVCALTGLVVAPAAMRSDPAALGRLIVATCGVAAREVMARRAAILTDFHEEFSA